MEILYVLSQGFVGKLFFCKGPDSKLLCFVGHTLLQLLNSAVVAAIKSTETNERGYVPIKMLFTLTSREQGLDHKI